ncbi:MAG: hypothetical protein HQ479_02025 [Rhodobacter sp.]|nr:hypothetical protein [Rhodobacter sp.]
MFDYLEGLRNSGFFKQFRHVVFTGTSMGGYAACAFCSLSPGSTVLAYSPQSTLAKDLVPWEKRFNRGRQQDWSGRYRDCTELTSEASKVYLCYDPYMAGDKAHADRYSGQNIVHLHSNYVGHKTVVFFRRAGILKNITKLSATQTGAFNPPKRRQIGDTESQSAIVGRRVVVKQAISGTRFCVLQFFGCVGKKTDFAFVFDQRIHRMANKVLTPRLDFAAKFVVEIDPDMIAIFHAPPLFRPT